MNKCPICKVRIADPTEKCPLCSFVVEHDGEQGRPMYPNARVAMRKTLLFERLVLFLSIVAVAGLVMAHVFSGTPSLAWVFVISLILLYANVILQMTITGRIGYQSKTVWLSFISIAVLVAIDALTGYHGWAMDYVFPSGILFINLGILILMVVNKRNWQSYMMMQILMILLSLLDLILYMTGVLNDLHLPVIAFTVSVLLFLGTVILGGSRARAELTRRFHV
ncbi:MAG: zinc ribbon domain-containing protein [Lachnospiraceae bacterium]|nr:zinc ribbon domain-containing protein [Lachnospiraceae bacterium]